jgi:putative zinc finger/helix-turn-helix YgiT family protein
MRCPMCGKELACNVEIYHYIESGLPNIFLHDVEVCKCSCGEDFVNIPSAPELHNIIGGHLIHKNGLLDGNEIKFLRKNMGLTAKKLSKIMSVDNATMSRWENNSQSIDKSYDRLLRLVYSAIKEIPIQKSKMLVEQGFSEIKNQKTTMPKFDIPIPELIRQNNSSMILNK